jgi:hypothetical protein
VRVGGKPARPVAQRQAPLLGLVDREAAHGEYEIAQVLDAGAAGVSSNIASVTETAGETGNAATQMLSATADLARQGERLRGEAKGFLERIRAA